MSALLNIQIHIKLTRKRYLYITLNIELTLLGLDNFANLMAKCKKKKKIVTTKFQLGKDVPVQYNFRRVFRAPRISKMEPFCKKS